MKLPAIAAIAVFAGLAFSQSQTMTEGAHRMEIVLERLNGNDWRAVDPALVLAQGDRVRFKFRTNFDGFLYVMNQSTSGKYEQLFPRIETGQENSVTANQQYQVPATSTAFRIAGPAGYRGGLLAGDAGQVDGRAAAARRAAARSDSEAADAHSALRRFGLAARAAIAWTIRRA